ncbi:MAG: DinB family protein [Chloroflexi bacterium]|nr:DinB family protein [Chloroflexota bacterium]
MVTQGQVRELREKLLIEHSRLVTTATSLTAEQAKRGRPDREGEEGWSPLQQLSHLWEMELLYDSWILAALERDRPDIGKLPMLQPAVTIERANKHSVPELLAVVESERARTLAILDQLQLDQYDRTALHPVFGELTVMQWLRSFYRHDRMHRMQMAGDEPDYQPRGNGAGMDQRRMRLRLGEERLQAIHTMDELLSAASQQDE